MSEDNIENLPSIDDYKDNSEELPSVDEFVSEEKKLPSVDDYKDSLEEFPSVDKVISEEKELPSLEDFIEEEEIEEEVKTDNWKDNYVATEYETVDLIKPEPLNPSNWRKELDSLRP